MHRETVKTIKTNNSKQEFLLPNKRTVTDTNNMGYRYSVSINPEDVTTGFVQNSNIFITL